MKGSPVRPVRKFSRAALMGSALTVLMLTGPSQATFHLMKVVEVFAGTPASPSAQYVVLQMYAAGQQFVSGHDVTVFNAAGTAVAQFQFPSNEGNGPNQAKILIATPQAVSFFGVNADLTMSPAMIAAGGKVCFAGTVDCVAWGSYAGSSSGVGTPFNVAGGGLRPGRAAVRRLDIAGSASSLDAGDDTNNCATDFVLGLPAPRNNDGALGTIPASTCGNGALEGLEECDDGNASNTDTCSTTCTVQAATARPRGDFNGDGRSDLFWRNSASGSNVVWRSANAATQVVLTTVADTNWRVVGKDDFTGDGQHDVFWRNIGTGANDIWKSANPATRQVTPSVPPFVWHVVGAGDFNGDGKGDIFWRNSDTGANELWRSATASGRQVLTAVTNLDWRVVGVGDFNGDGKADVFWRNSATGQNAIWLSANAATQQFTATVASAAWRVAGVGDFNGDGRADVLWRNLNSGANELWRSGTSSQRQVLTTVSNLSWIVADTGDYDGDGKSDLFWRNASNGQNVIWKSANAATQQHATTVANLQWSVVPLPLQ